MKSHCSVLLNAAPEDAEWVLGFSEKALSFIPEIKEVTYEKGSEADFGTGTVLLLKMNSKGRESSAKVEILDFKKGEFIAQRFKDSHFTSTTRATLSRDGSKALLISDTEITLNSPFLKPLTPFLARPLKRVYLKRLKSLARYFDPQSTSSAHRVQFTMLGMPVWLFLLLFWLGATGCFNIIVRAF